MLAGCWCRPAQQLLLLMLLTTASLLLIGMIVVSEPAQRGVFPAARPPPPVPPVLTGDQRPPASPVLAGTGDEPPPARPQATGTVAGCPPPGHLLSVNSIGRLGNVISEYATLLAAGRALRRPAWLQPAMARTLARYFERPSLPALPDAGCRLNWTAVLVERLLAERPDTSQDHLISGFPHAVPLFHPLRQELARDFTFNAKLRERADRRLAELARQANLSSPTFIGVHVRRTDYNVWLLRRVGGLVVGAAYLRRAVALMRRRHAPALFVVASDDMAWCARELRGLDLVPAGDRNLRRPGADLALLAACNHTVVTHGTFGFWAAYLAGGEVVAPTGYGRRPTGLERDVRRAQLGWTWLPVDSGRQPEVV